MLQGLGLDDREVQFAQQLASNKLKTRYTALKKLENFLRTIDEDSITDEEFLKLWKGLFYCMWLSDKVQVQQELAQKIAALLHSLPSPSASFQFLKCFYITMNREWHGIDYLRLDKFYSLQRRMLEESLKIALAKSIAKYATSQEKNAKNSENEEENDEEGEDSEEEVENENCYLWTAAVEQGMSESTPGILMHLAEIFVPTLEKLLPEGRPGEKTISDLDLAALLLPFYTILQTADDIRIINRAKDLFRAILKSKYATPHEIPEEFLKDADAAEKHFLELTGTFKFAAHVKGIEEGLFVLATDKKTAERNRTHIYELHKKYQNFNVLPKEEDTRVIYKPLTSEEAALRKRKRKGKKKGKKGKHPAKKPKYQ